MKDTLFILRPGFFKDSEGPFYCGDSVSVEGLLSFYPQLRDAVNVEYVDAPRPREPIVALIGEGNQSAPVLVLGEKQTPKDGAIGLREHNGRRFIDSPADIRQYLSSQYGIAHVA
ncbi:DUF3088 domain-containing protein [Burkholderia sp. Ac-20353]|uniref:DUF3088 domain-containing protein n=1 Tax=Burkholderia sp. Ac-20353 TaxID=2703894 RepID=UPI00197C094B|nr:DUF3088 domain-containing protein [Burkholderia sp. Ac-20353]MBN3791146.1 DUF3088 domain-containing protein [Burkholderia sp. Ac-20353]